MKKVQYFRKEEITTYVQCCGVEKGNLLKFSSLHDWENNAAFNIH
jgi:hypothetical protein